MSIDGRHQTIMSFRLPDHLREELSRAADVQNIADSVFLRNALVSALVKHAQRVDTRSNEFEGGMPLPMTTYDW
jgi:hypothetical protein